MIQRWLLVIITLGTTMLTISCDVDLSTFDNIDDLFALNQTAIGTAVPVNEPATNLELPLTTTPNILPTESKPADDYAIPSTK